VDATRTRSLDPIAITKSFSTEITNAKFENGKASVGLQFIPKESPFYNLEGKDNIVQFYTDRYVDQPLLIKGAGAGAAVTASGIFADVIRIGKV
jgi:aspartokinase/homoserine dehydrogenase 1